jgi:prevent-host-death family protein
MKTFSATEFKARCLAILDEVAETGETVTITKRGKPVACVIPPLVQPGEFPQQRLQGTVRILGDVISPVLPPEAWDANHPPDPDGAS